ncbi:hypothetical protein MHF_1189 [Mycoplasma haemofelis Ohio2]|uniref:Uncharacterized protein n=1 Tax=Mycoplasma haemofelis (strain Ohio2) TaxID=859194 RepID=F6FJS5_MYCHI|nr:hypothetical protein MHF_1189 [Mycoplasma haemofelis Ohio2]
MNFSKRIPFLLFPGGFLGFTFTGMDDDVPTLILTEEEKATLEQQISEFLKIAGTSKGAKDLIEGYLKTTVGAKVFAQKLTEHFLVKFIDTFTPTTSSSSAIKDRLKNKLLHLRNSASGEIDENKVFAGNENLKKEYTVLSRIKPVFQEVLRDVLTSSLSSLSSQNSSSGEEKLLVNNSDPDSWNKKLAEFWEHVFDDYVTYEKPIPFKKVTWKYDSADKTNEIRALFDDSQIPTGTTLPSSASYFFPFVSDATHAKFKSFIGKHKQKQLLSQDLSRDLSQYSDESKTDFIAPISGIASIADSSQEAIAILELAQYFSSEILVKTHKTPHEIAPQGLSTYNGYGRDYGKTQKFRLLEASSSSSSDENKENNCSKESDKDGSVPVLTSEKLNEKKLHEIFCIVKGSSWFDTGKELGDFFYLKEKEKKTKKNTELSSETKREYTESH